MSFRPSWVHPPAEKMKVTVTQEIPTTATQELSAVSDGNDVLMFSHCFDLVTLQQIRNYAERLSFLISLYL